MLFIHNGEVSKNRDVVGKSDPYAWMKVEDIEKKTKTVTEPVHSKLWGTNVWIFIY
jgi:hypothetical protein